MSSTTAKTERTQFSARLQQALATRGYAPDSPTVLAREFNVRFSGNPVTVHAARKWLIGESIPTQEKIRLLGEWLAVSVQWLRYGDESDQIAEGKGHKANQLSRKEISILQGLRILNVGEVELIHQLIMSLSQKNSQKAA